MALLEFGRRMVRDTTLDNYYYDYLWFNVCGVYVKYMIQIDKEDVVAIIVLSVALWIMFYL